LGIGAERRRDVAGSGSRADDPENHESSEGGGSGEQREGACTIANPVGLRRDRGTKEERKCGIGRHGVILLGGREGKKEQDESEPAESEKASSARAVIRFVGEPDCGRQVDTPGEEPDEVQEPEGRARNCGVVARIAEVEVTEKLFVDDEKPEEAVILAGTAVQSPREVRRIAERGEDVPGSGDDGEDKESAEGTKALQGTGSEELARNEQEKKRRGKGNHDGDEAFDEKADRQADGKEGGPELRTELGFIERSDEGEERKCDA